MDKNPIGYLQEYLMKRQITHNYDFIESRSGTHINWFKIRVTCGHQSAYGEGSSKKEAKTNAAKAMIALLGINSSNDYVPIQSNISTSGNALVNNINTSNSDLNINYIGRLQEIAQKQGKILPVYTDKTPSGPSHIPIFTTVCKFMDLEVEANASTKKEAKTLAAKKMFELMGTEFSNVQVCNSKEELKSYLETIEKAVADLKIHDENKNNMAESAQKALALYLPLSKTNATKKVNINDQRSYNNYHTFLRDAFSDKDREHVMDQLQETIRACNGENGSNPMALLKLALKQLKINVKEVNYDTRKKTYIFGLQLDTDPVISEIGHGDSQSSAAVQSALQMAVTVSILIA